MTEPNIIPQQIVARNKVISAEELLTLAIQFLAMGESFRSLNFQFHSFNRAIFSIVKSVCNTIVKYLVPLYLSVPSTEEEWLSIPEKFESFW